MLASTNARNVYTGDGATSNYGWNWLINQASDLRVAVLSNASPQVLTVLTLGVDFTIQTPATQVGNSGGGNIVLSATGFLAPTTGFLPTGWGLIIRRSVTFGQPGVLGDQEGSAASQIESMIDYLAMQTLQILDALGRTIQTPIDDYAAPNQNLPVASLRAGAVLGFDTNGNPALVSGTIPAIGVTPFWVTILAMTTAALSRAGLGFNGAGGTVQTANIDPAGLGSAAFAAGSILTAAIGAGQVTFNKLAADVQASYDALNIGIAASVAANAMTVALKTKAGSNPSAADLVNVAMRSVTSTSGVFVERTVAAALSLSVASGATLGQASGVAQYVYVYLIDNAGTLELAVAGTQVADSGSVVSTTAMSNSSTDPMVLYSTSARSNVPCRLIGRILSTQAAAGTWVTVPSEISVAPFGDGVDMSEIVVSTGAGHGSTNTKIRRIETAVRSVGASISVTQSATLGTSMTINKDGLYEISYCDDCASATIGISLNSTQLTTSIRSITAADRISGIASGVGVNVQATVTVTKWLKAGDVVRPHVGDDGNPTATDPWIIFKVTRLR